MLKVIFACVHNAGRSQMAGRSSINSRTPRRHRRSQRVRSRECVSIPKSKPLCRKSEST